MMYHPMYGMPMGMPMGTAAYWNTAAAGHGATMVNGEKMANAMAMAKSKDGQRGDRNNNDDMLYDAQPSNDGKNKAAQGQGQVQVQLPPQPLVQLQMAQIKQTGNADDGRNDESADLDGNLVAGMFDNIINDENKTMVQVPGEQME